MHTEISIPNDELNNLKKLVRFKQNAIKVIKNVKNINYTEELINESVKNIYLYCHETNYEIGTIDIINAQEHFRKKLSEIKSFKVIQQDDSIPCSNNYDTAINIMGLYVVANIIDDKYIDIYVYINNDDESNMIIDIYNLVNK